MHELYTEFITTAKEVLRITEMVELTGGEVDNEVDNQEKLEAALNSYAKLYQKREPMLRKLNRLVEQMDFAKLEDEQKETARNTLNAILAADQQLAEQAQKFNYSMRGEMQGIGSAKKLTTGYTHPSELEAQVGGSFDTKQ